MTDHHQHQQQQQQQQHHLLQQTENLSPSGRKESNCVRCRNHGLRVTLKGHKTYCPYAACTCDKCRFTAEQQRQMRVQNAIRRAEGDKSSSSSVVLQQQQQQPGRKRKSSTNHHHESSSSTVLPQQQQQQQQSTSSSSHHHQPHPQQHPPPPSQQIVMTTVAANCNNSTSAAAAASSSSSTSAEDKKMLFDCSSELVKKFQWGWEMMPIMYALSKYANGNIDEILRRIEEAQFAVNEHLRQQTINMYFAAGANNQNNQNLPTITFVATRECG